MRSRERLIDVLNSTNKLVVGFLTASTFQSAAGALQERNAFDPFMLKRIMATAKSPHIQELAEEAISYIEVDESLRKGKIA